MARKNEYVIGIINALEQTKKAVDKTPDIVAEEFLRSTLEDYPRPPIQTGALRRSGAAYVGNRLVATTTGLAAKYPELAGLLVPRESSGNSASSYKKPTETLRSRQVVDTIRVSGTMGGTSLRGNISIVYSNPVAALMHEWAGGFSDPTGQSGAHYISSKAVAFRGRTQTRLRQVFQQGMV